MSQDLGNTSECHNILFVVFFTLLLLHEVHTHQKLQIHHGNKPNKTTQLVTSHQPPIKIGLQNIPCVPYCLVHMIIPSNCSGCHHVASCMTNNRQWWYTLRLRQTHHLFSSSNFSKVTNWHPSMMTFIREERMTSNYWRKTVRIMETDIINIINAIYNTKLWHHA